MPSPLSREAGFHYGNPRNRFWPVVAALWKEPTPQSREERLSLLRRHHLALHDVLRSCDIDGASDASINHPVPNDLAPILRASEIRTIFCTGTTATRLYRKLIEPVLGLPCVGLPSTSPANARWSFEKLVDAYGLVRDAVEGGAWRSDAAAPAGAEAAASAVTATVTGPPVASATGAAS